MAPYPPVRGMAADNAPRPRYCGLVQALEARCSTSSGVQTLQRGKVIVLLNLAGRRVLYMLKLVAANGGCVPRSTGEAPKH